MREKTKSHRLTILVLLMVLFLSPMSSVMGTNLYIAGGNKTLSQKSQEIYDTEQDCSGETIFQKYDYYYDKIDHEGDDVLKNQNFTSSPSIYIKMKAATFDPLKGGPKLSTNWEYSKENDYYLVQFIDPMQTDWLYDIIQKGAIILSYVPDNTYIMALNRDIKARIQNLPFVRWIGAYYPFYKIQNRLYNKSGNVELGILVFKDSQDNVVKVRDRLEELGCEITYDGNDNNIIIVKANASKLWDIASIPEIEWIEEYMPPKSSMNNIRDYTGANTANANGFNGSGIVGEVKDDGIDQNHPDFDGQLIGTVGNPPTSAHGTCAFGIVFSSGAHDPNAKGMLPGGEGVFCEWDVSRSASANDLVNNWGGVFQSNSWSQGLQDSDYSIFSYENDQVVADYNIVMLHSAGNSDDGVYSYSCSQDSVAKNVIGVGGIYHHDNNQWSDDAWEDWGPGGTPAQGPATDGRVKPDLVGPFDSIYTTDVTGAGGYAPGNYYNFGGTSGATPVVAGAVGLVYQMYKEDHFGNNPSGSLPHASTVKAILIADAHQYDFSQATRYRQGWGSVDVGKVYGIGENHFIVDESRALQNGQSAKYILESTGGSIKISLVWNDPPGTTSSLQHLVNDLDLKVTDPNGDVYSGNWGLMNSKWSLENGNPDTLNNVENVFIESPTPGIYIVEVIAEHIRMEGYPASPEIDQTFALVASNTAQTLFVDIINPQEGSILNDVVIINGTASGYITDIEVKIDDGPWQLATGTSVWSYNWDTTVLGDGAHTVYVRGTNGSLYTDVVSVQVSIDNTPPVTSILVGNPNYFKDTKWYVISSTQFTLIPVDEGSGVNITRYRIYYGGNLVQGWTPGNVLTLNWGEGEYSIQYYSIDNLSNSEETKTEYAYVDLSAPITDIEVGPQKFRAEPNNIWNVTQDTIFSFITLEEMTLVAFFWYTIDGKYFEGQNFNLGGYHDGLHEITWGGQDYFGHNESVHYINVTLDSAPPSVTYEIGQPTHRKYPYHSYNVTEATTFTIQSTDLLSGLNFTWYIIDNKFFKGDNFTLEGFDDGPHNVKIGASDNIGNNITKFSLSFYLDSQPPETDLIIGDEKVRLFEYDLWNVTSTTSFKLYAFDEYAGVNITWYSIDSDYHEKRYYDKIEFNLANLEDGKHIISWGSIDNLSQPENVNSITVYLDTEPPKTNLSIGMPKYRAATSDFWNVTSSTLFILTPNDFLSGVNLTWYRIDGLYFLGTTFTLGNLTDGYHTITWGSIDRLGHNETGNVQTVYLHSKLPVTFLELERKRYRRTEVDFWNVTSETIFLLSPDDIHPGINFTWYIIDGIFYKGNIFTLSGLEEGGHQIKWGSVDNLSLNETGNAITVILDDTPPITGLEIGNPKYRASIDEPWAVTSSTIFTFLPEDEYSDLVITWYKINDSYFLGTVFTMLGYEDGFYTITWGSEDNLDHNETEHQIMIQLDNTPPIITVEVGQPRLHVIDVFIINSSTTFTLIPKDTGVNRSTIFYTYDEGSIYHPYTGPFTVSSRANTIIFWGKDVLGNEADESIINVIMDNTDTDEDGIDDIGDIDDDNDGLTDEEENLKGTNPLNPDSDGDGYKDGVDAYPLDKEKWNGEGNLLIILILISIIIVIALILVLFFVIKQMKEKEKNVQWSIEEDTIFEPQEKQKEVEGNTKFMSEEDKEIAQNQDLIFEPHSEPDEWFEEEMNFKPEEEGGVWTEKETEFKSNEEQVDWSEEETIFEPQDESKNKPKNQNGEGEKKEYINFELEEE